MLRAAIAFFALGIIAILFGAYGIAGVSMEAGRLLLGVFVVLAVISVVANMVSGRKRISLTKPDAFDDIKKVS